MKRLILLLLVSGVGLQVARAAEVNATLQTNRLHVGDRATLTIRTVHDTAERCIPPDIDRPPFVVVWDEETTSREAGEGRTETITTVTFTSFVIGQHRVTTGAVTVIGSGDTRRSLALPELLIEVETLLGDPLPEMADIKPAVAIPGQHWQGIAAMAGLVALLAAVAALCVRWWRRRPQRSPSVRIVPPHEIALKALAALQARGFMESGQAEPFYVELSAIIRIYLEQRFDLHAPEQTTEEFIRNSSQSMALSVEHRQLTREFLEQSDLVKFARFTPGLQEMQAALDAAGRLVRETIPSPAAGATP